MDPKELGNRIEKAKAKAYRKPDPIDITKLWTKEKPATEDAGTSAMDHIISHLDHAKFILDKGSFRDSDELEFQDHYKEIDALISARAPNSDLLAKMRQHVPGVDDSDEEIRAELMKMIEIELLVDFD